MLTTIWKALLLAGVLANAAMAQASPRFRSDVEIVVVPFVVVDSDGRTVGGLTREDFRVYDNDTRRPIENLWIDRDSPITLGVIIDASESQRNNLAEHSKTAVDLLQRMLRPGDRFFVIHVDEDVRLWIDLAEAGADVGGMMSRRPADLFGRPCARQKNNLAGARSISACGSSPLWDAIHDAARLRLGPLTGHKTLLILTDGFDSGSKHTWRQAADAVSATDATLYAIQYSGGFGRSFAPDLYRLVADTGGAWFRPSMADISPIAARIETDLRHRYVLGFRPERLSGKARHRIRIEVTRPDLTVRARKTYFQEP